MKRIITILFIILPGILTAQLDTIGFPVITSYTPIEYHAHFQNWDAIQADDGIMYFANGDGVLIFDGVNWETIEMPNQEAVRSIEISESGTIYVAGDNVLGYLTADSLNNLKYVSIIDIMPDEYDDYKVFWQMDIVGEILYIRTSYHLFVIENQKHVKTYKTDEPFFSTFISSKNILYMYERNKLSWVENDSLGTYNTDKTIIDFFERSDTVFFVTTDNFIYYISDNHKPVIYNKINYDFSNSAISEVLLYKNDYLIYTTVNKGVIVIDFKGNLKSLLNKESGILVDNIYNVYIDKYDNLWVQTNSGISHVELSSPLRVVDSRFDFDYSHPLFMSKFKDEYYSCTGNKLYKINFGGNFNSSFEEIVAGNVQTWSGIEIGNELYIGRNSGILRIDKNNNTKIYGPYNNVWTIKQIPSKPNHYIVGYTLGLLIYKYDGDSLRFVKKIHNFSKNSREIKFLDEKAFVVGVSDGLYKITLSDSLTIDKNDYYGAEKGLYNSNSILFFEWKDKFFISTYKTLFEFDSKNDTIYEFHSITDKFNTDGKKVLQLIGIDYNDVFWFEYYNDEFDAEIYCFKKEDEIFIETNKFTKRLLNYGFIFLSDYKEQKTIVGTTKGFVFINNCNENLQAKHSFNTYVRKVYYTTKDSLLYGGNILDGNGKIIREFERKDKLIIEYKNNNLRFVFASPFFIEPQKTKYRVKLENYDENWSSWSHDSRRDYTNLPPGNYTLLVEAKNIFGETSNITKFKIFVKYPWYRTIYAYIGYIVLLLIILYGIVKFFTFRLRRRNEKLEQLVEDRTYEIKQKNVELEQQKEEILTQAEELQIVNNELEKLSTIVRETDNAVILADKDGNFIWINQAFTKIFGYTFDELVTNISPNLIADRTEDRIKDIVNKCLTEKITVEYELKVVNKEGKKIWVHTTLTPLLDENGEITSLVAIDADITQQKKYEEQIIEQRDQITASIRYALKIQESILPNEEEISAIFDNFIIYEPKDIVSGDFYWISNVFRTENNRFRRVSSFEEGMKAGQTVFFSVVDCTGHGVPGAFMSLIGSRLLGEIVNEMRIASPKDILYHLDFRLGRALKRSQKRNYDGMVVSLCRMDKILENDQEKMKITFAGAKQHITYYKRKTKEFIKLRGSARQIGFFVNEDLSFFEKEFILEKGDSLFIYSDGLKDLNNPQRDSFGHSRIIRHLRENIEKPIEEIGDILEAEMNNWLADDLQRDDVTFIGIRIK